MIKRKLVSFIEDRFMVPECVVCGDRATGEGPRGDPRCFDHCREEWAKIEARL